MAVAMALCLPLAWPGRSAEASATPPMKAKPQKPDQEAYIPPMLRPDWPGLAAGIDPGTLIEVEQLEADAKPSEESTPSYTVTPEELEAYAEELADREAAGLPTYELEFETKDGESRDDSMFPKDAPLLENEDRMLTFVFGDAKTGKEYHHRIRASDLRAAAWLKHGGANEQSSEQAPISEARRAREDEILKSWSNSTDNRTPRGIANGYPAYDPVYSSLVDYGACSGVIIESSSNDIYVLTAAHCAFNPNGSLKTTRLYPRRDGSTKPYGYWIPANYFDWDQFKNRDCHNDWDFNRCASSDLVMIRATPGPGALIPHHFGYALKTKAQLNTYNKYRRGYPKCTGAGAPNSCSIENTLYGDGALSLGSVYFEGSTGWYAVIDHSSDTNDNDSGSGMYYLRSDDKRFVWGVHISGFENCYSNCSYSTPNSTRRITPWWYNYISTNIP